MGRYWPGKKESRDRSVAQGLRGMYLQWQVAQCDWAMGIQDGG